jgi:hypothetical protein
MKTLLVVFGIILPSVCLAYDSILVKSEKHEEVVKPIVTGRWVSMDDEREYTVYEKSHIRTYTRKKS